MPAKPTREAPELRIRELEKAKSFYKKKVEMLQENVIFCQSLIDTVNDGIFVHTITPDGEPGKFCQVNAAARKMLGYSNEEFKAMSPWELDDPATRAQIIPMVMKELRTSGSTRFEATQICKDGRKISVEVNTVFSVVQDQEYIVSVCRDITRRRRIENDLLISEQRFRKLVEDLPKIAVQGYDSNRNVIYWNHASELLYGYSEREAVGRKLEDLIIPAAMKDTVISAIHDWFTHDVPIPSSELVLRHKDGSEVPVYSSHIKCITNTGQVEMYCVDLDLAELKLAQEKGQESEWFYRQLFNHSSSGVAVYDAVDNGQDFIFKDINKAGERIGSVMRKDLLGQRVTKIYPDIKNLGLLEVFSKVWLTEEPAAHPVSLYRDNKLHRWLENRVYKLPGGEIVAVYEDITKEKQLEEEKSAIELRLQRAEKMEAIGLLAGGVAHDLNNILAGIIGYPDLMLQKLEKTSTLRKPLEAIRESGERAVAVVADLLTVARNIANTKTAVNMNSLIAEYLDSPECHHLRSQHEHIECCHDLAADLPEILCSPVHIKKCIMNLVTNALESFSKLGKITISTTSTFPEEQWAAKNGLEPKTYVVLSVMDTGAGISPEDIEHIFEPFYTRKVMGRSGTGLGLTVVWNTMEDHGGKIFVKSNKNGTCFQLYFPATPTTLTQEINNDDDEGFIGNGEHILVVDDEPHLLDIASQILHTSHYTVHTASSGELAVTFLKKTKVDLILMDMVMDPGMNGYQTYQEILKFSPKQKVILVSGFSENDDVKAALRLGAEGFLKKPYSLDQLRHAVKRALKTGQ